MLLLYKVLSRELFFEYLPKVIFTSFLDESFYSYNQILLVHLLQSYDKVIIPQIMFYNKLFLVIAQDKGPLKTLNRQKPCFKLQETGLMKYVRHLKN